MFVVIKAAYDAMLRIRLLLFFGDFLWGKKGVALMHLFVTQNLIGYRNQDCSSAQLDYD